MGRSAVVVLALAGAAVLLACSSGEGSTPPSTTAAPATTTSTVAPTTTLPDQAVLAAYQAYWDTWLAANDPPDPDHPGLARHYTGVALDRARASIAENQANGVVLRLPPGSQFGFSVETLDVLDDAAGLVVCLVDDGQVIDLATGTVLDDRAISSRIEVRLVRSNGHWQVEENAFMSTSEGISGCDDS